MKINEEEDKKNNTTIFGVCSETNIFGLGNNANICGIKFIMLHHINKSAHKGSDNHKVIYKRDIALLFLLFCYVLSILFIHQ